METLAGGVTFPAIDDPILIIAIDGNTGIPFACRGRVLSYDANAPAFWYRAAGWAVDNDGIMELQHEGIRWARGHDAETEGALLAAYALHDNNRWWDDGVDRWWDDEVDT